MINSGDVVYFKKAKRFTKRGAPEATFKGHGFGVFLGHLPPLKKDVLAIDLMKLMGSIGFLTFDDVGEFLGEEVAADVIKKFEDKYFGRAITAQELDEKMAAIKKERQTEQATALVVPPPEQKLHIPAPLQLVDTKGDPVDSEDRDE